MQKAFERRYPDIAVDAELFRLVGVDLPLSLENEREVLREFLYGLKGALPSPARRRFDRGSRGRTVRYAREACRGQDFRTASTLDTSLLALPRTVQFVVPVGAEREDHTMKYKTIS
ncbi:MAG TPA: hypothetical protein VN812_10250 [Candidatus Acidoferrales bacterium]|nr:hypothetical protein [Candidatus Acidoferrales bacterium]